MSVAFAQTDTVGCVYVYVYYIANLMYFCFLQSVICVKYERRFSTKQKHSVCVKPAILSDQQ